LFQIFKKLDIDNDRRIDFNEFKKGYELMGINVNSTKELKAKFDEIDTNHGGHSLFDEVNEISVIGYKVFSDT
jgi:Ca2+-binding EF-hand superfamily protein